MHATDALSLPSGFSRLVGLSGCEGWTPTPEQETALDLSPGTGRSAETPDALCGGLCAAPGGVSLRQAFGPSGVESFAGGGAGGL